MPTGPLPESFRAFLEEPNKAVIATVRTDGRPQTAPTWYEYRDGDIWVNMDAGRVRLRHMRANPNVSISIMWHRNWQRHVTIVGRVVDIKDDPDMAHIDALANRYLGHIYKSRESARVIAVIAIDAWYGWDATTFTTDAVAGETSSFPTP